jgi:hypothetical protein|tara:strand:- start:956 stop:1123 length:168 start_codon:yes stop_codon:yes gene_type:complete
MLFQGKWFYLDFPFSDHLKEKKIDENFFLARNSGANNPQGITPEGSVLYSNICFF